MKTSPTDEDLQKLVTEIRQALRGLTDQYKKMSKIIAENRSKWQARRSARRAQRE